MEMLIEEISPEEYTKNVEMELTREKDEKDESNVEDIGYFDPEKGFVSTIEENKVIVNKLPVIGSFHTIQNVKKTPAAMAVPKSVQFNTPNNQPEKTIKTYDSILQNMGMCVVNGKLQLYNTEVNNTQYDNNQQKHGQQTHIQQDTRKPLTKEEYKQSLYLEIARRRNEQIRINQFKSKKLLFNNPSVNIISSAHSKPVKNVLFKFVGLNR
jgi:hypothetical protein